MGLQLQSKTLGFHGKVGERIKRKRAMRTDEYEVQLEPGTRSLTLPVPAGVAHEARRRRCTVSIRFSWD